MNYFQCIHFAGFIILSLTKKPSDKQQQAIWRLECELGVISDSECPVDGGWTPWSPWSACNGLCDDLGQRRRVRKCTNPVPSSDGLPCSGSDHQVESCHIANCSIEDYRKLVDGDAIRTDALRLLEAVPTLMEQCLLMECPFEAIEAALAYDNTWQFNAESLWNAFQCVKHNLGCPVIGEWGSWSEWSACGARCGFGLRWRYRKCDTPPPSSIHLICTGTPLQASECQGDQCAVDKRDSGGNWSNWSQWSACSEKCGAGVRRRKRVCLETNTPRLFGSWGTHCRGQHDQLEACENKECKLDGGWSGWGPWGPCSQSCGAGKRSRSRSCTRPEPSGSGSYCSSPRTEVGSCHIKPCITFPHVVATFKGESLLHYNFKNKRSTYFHFYVRFLPLSPHGTLVRRGSVHNPLVRLNLQKWHICLDAGGLSNTCTVPRICSRNVIEPAVWHSVMITVTSEGIAMRIDNDSEPIKSTFSCDPELPNDKVIINVGERFHGEIQEILLNFIPLCIVIDRDRDDIKSDYCPTMGANIAYEKADAEEAYIILDDDQILRLPCPDDQEDWRIQLTIKSFAESGTILFLQDMQTHTWLLLYLQNMRLKLKLAMGDFRSEKISSIDYLPNQWLDINVLKSRDANAIEVSINAQERLHVLFENVDIFTRKRRMFKNYSMIRNRDQKFCFVMCAGEYLVGGVTDDLKRKIALKDLTFFSGIIVSVSVNNVLYDLNDYSLERYKDNNVQISSRTASVSGSYYETAWGKSNSLNLTCLHTRSTRSPNTAHWLLLDSTINSQKAKSIRSVDDGKVLRLVATAENDIRGFYTCRAHTEKRSKNIVTYGVLGQIDYKLSGPDLTTVIAVITTLALVLGTLACLFIEGIHDIRNGYGFYRDIHLSPEEEAEVICKYIDQNINLMASKSAADIAKAKARKIARQMARDSSSIVEEPEGFMLVENLLISTDESVPSEPEGLPALPGILGLDTTLEVFKCEPSYVSSPRHGSISSPKTKLTSLSSLDITPPKVISSRLRLNNRLHKAKESLTSRKHSKNRVSQKSNISTVKSSTRMNSPALAERILQKFRELKSDDT